MSSYGLDILANVLDSASQTVPAVVKDINDAKERKRKALLDAQNAQRENTRDDLLNQLTQQQIGEGSQKASDAELAQKHNDELDKLLGRYSEVQKEKPMAESLGKIDVSNMEPSVPEGPSTSLITGETTGMPARAPLTFGDSTENQDEISKRRALAAGAGIEDAGKSLRTGQSGLGKSRMGLFTDLGGLKYADAPKFQEVAGSLSGQDKAEQEAELKKEQWAQTSADKAAAIEAANQRAREYNELMGVQGGLKNSARDFQFSIKDQQQQDKLEQQYRDILAKTMPRNPAFRIQDQKVASAIHTRQAFETNRDENGQLHLNQITTPEAALSLASLVSGKTTTNLEEFKSMTPQSLYKSVKEAVGYIVGKPVDVLPKEWADNIQHMIDRQGVVSEGIRDKYLEQYRKFKPSRLEDSRAKTIEVVEIGPSYSETFGITPEEKDQIVNPGKHKGQAAQPASGTSKVNLSGDKAKRLEELRRKAAEGTIK